MLINKDIKQYWEYRAICENEDDAVDFANYLRGRGVDYIHIDGSDVYYLRNDIDGIRLAKPFIVDLTNKKFEKSKEIIE